MTAFAIKIHLPVTEARTVGFSWPLVNARAVRDIGGLGRLALLFRPAVILALVPGVGKQQPALVGVDVVVDCLPGDVCPFFGQDADNLRRGPLFFRNPLFYTP